MPWLHIFNFPKLKFALGNLHSKEDNFSKQVRRKMKEGSMHDEPKKSVLYKTKISCHAHYRYIICILHWFLWKPKSFDNF